MARENASGWKADLKHILLRSSGVVAFLILWEIGPRVGWADPVFIPPPSVILLTLRDLLASGELITHILVSLRRVFFGFLLAAAVGIPLGFLLGGWFKTFHKILDPLLQILGQANPFSLFPVFILLFGIGEVAKIAIIYWVCQWPILFNTVNGIQNIDPLLIKSARSMGASKFELFKKVVLPGAAPSIFLGLRMSAVFSFFMLIAAEMLGATAGLGWLVWNSQVNYQIQKLFAAVVTIAVLGVLITKFFIWLEKKVIVWKEEAMVG